MSEEKDFNWSNSWNGPFSTSQGRKSLSTSSVASTLNRSFKSSFTSTVDNSEYSSTPQIWIEEIPATSTVKAVSAVEELSSRFKKGLEECLDSDFFEPGIKSATENYVEKWLIDQPVLVQLAMGKVFLENTSDEKRMVGILTVVAHLDRSAFHPTNELIALSSLSHASVEVREFAVRAYEYWEDPVLAARLRDFPLTPKWLDDYRKEVIADICGGN